MGSDLVGIPVTLAAVAVVAITIAGFWLAGSVGGILFALLGLGLIWLLVVRPGSKPPAGATPSPPPRRDDAQAEGERLVLVVANHALAEPALADRLQLNRSGSVRIRIVVPASPDSHLRRLADDIDEERRAATARMETLLTTLRAAGIDASGRVDDEADPRSALADGLRQFAADQVVLVRGDERGWPEAAELASKLRRDGVEVAELNAGEGGPSA
jgi:hypothetical protein